MAFALKIAAAAALCFFVTLLLRLTKTALRTPVFVGKNTKICLILSICGPEPGLEATVEDLRCLIWSGLLPAAVFLRDEGMDSDTRAVAELLERDGKIEIVQQ